MSDHALNLDELFGSARPVKVTWQTKEYELTRPEGLNPVQHQAFMKLYTGIQKMQLDLDTDPKRLADLVDELLNLLNPGLVKAKIPFGAKIKVLEFYSAEVLEPKKGMTVEKNPIGEKPTQD